MSGGKFGFATRSSGVLLHPTSLPGRHGVGDLGEEAYRFADFLAAAGQRWWQMLPVGPIGMAPGYSPYSSESAFAGSAWLVAVGGEGESRKTEVRRGRADYAAAIREREPRLREAFEKWGAKGTVFGEFCEANAGWLEDYALFAALKEAHGGKGWDQWERGVRLRMPGALNEARGALAGEVLYQKFVQYLFDRQWRKLRAYCHARGVGLIGDIPIFVAYDSADVWANRELFLLDKHGRPTVVTGCPPDAYARGGQKWNHPHYDWAAHRAEGYAWWVARFASMASRFDGVRIDHFLGFQRAWAVPARAKDARRGTWMAGPGEGVFRAVRRGIGEYPIIAEDLGAVTPEAAALRDKVGFPGMRVLQFGFGDGGELHLPHNYVPGCVAYTGTHDNHTAAGWFEKLPKRSVERTRVLEYVGGDAREVHRNMVRAVMTSVAGTAIFPVQDLLGLRDEARMNVPGVDRGNWRWRMRGGELTNALAGELRRLTEVSGRGKK